MRVITRLGEMLWKGYGDLRYAAALIATALYYSVQPWNWKRASREVLARQVLVVGVEPVLFVCAMAMVAGMSVVVQLAFWTREAGQTQLLGPLLVAVVARELAPILVNIVVAVRSSGALRPEMGDLKMNGENGITEEQAVDPFLFLMMMPRVVAAAVSAFCLTVIFILAAFASGYLFGAWLGSGNRYLWPFMNSVFHALRPQDIISILAQSTVPALFTSAFCSIEEMRITSVMDLPSAAQRSLRRSIGGLFTISMAVLLLTYL